MEPRERSELIRARAYELWELRGRPDGRQWEHWLEAEREIAEAESEAAASRRQEPLAASPARDAWSASSHSANGDASNGEPEGWLGWLPEWLREKATELESAAQRLARGRGSR